MKKKLLILPVIIFCAIILVALKLIFFRTTPVDGAILKFTRDMNRHCPAMIDVETRMDTVIFLANNTLTFKYTLIRRDRDSLNIGNLKMYMEPVVQKQIKDSPVLSKLIGRNLTWIYSYNDRKGLFIFKLLFTSEQLSL